MKFSLGLLLTAGFISAQSSRNNQPTTTIRPPITNDDRFDNRVEGSSRVSRGSGRSYRFNMNPARAVLQLRYGTNEQKRSFFFSISTQGFPRIGYEWQSTEAFQNGTAESESSFSIRFIGLSEVNATLPSANNLRGMKYLFRDFRWSPFALQQNVPIPNANDTLATKFVLSSVGTHPQGLAMNLSVDVVTEPFTVGNRSMLRPTDLKYTVAFTGAPRYNLEPATNSSWKLVHIVSAKTNNPQVSNGTLNDGPSRFTWISDVLADNVTRSITVDGLNSTMSTWNPSEARLRQPGNRTRDDDVDDAQVSRFMSFNLPHFNNSLVWDPSIGINESVAVGNNIVKSSAVSRQTSHLMALAVTGVMVYFMV